MGIFVITVLLAMTYILAPFMAIFYVVRIIRYKCMDSRDVKNSEKLKALVEERKLDKLRALRF
jgi:uncharacterized membrane protein